MKVLGKYKRFFLFFAVLSGLILILFYNALVPKKILPIFQPAMVSFELVDSTLQHIKRQHRVGKFSLRNQNGEIISSKDYEGKIYVADFFFTTCPTICITMTDNMIKIQNEILDQPNVMLLSHSVTPEIDSVPQLKKYAVKKGVLDHKWNLVTGDKKEIYHLARKSYLAVKEDGDGGPFDMIHTENFILIDPKGRIRGFYDGTDEKEIGRLLEELSILTKEYFSS